jgi:nitrite reductase/ring-hydroxylating ferredoxin subunit
MAEQQTSPAGPDLTQGVAPSDLVNGKLVGHVGREEVLLVQAGAQLFAIGAHCTHYHGPLADGIVVGETVRCPWHHACFDLRNGEATRTPAFNPVDCWNVEQRDGLIFVTTKQPQAKPRRAATANAPGRIVNYRRWRRRIRGCRDDAAARFCRRHHHAER